MILQTENQEGRMALNNTLDLMDLIGILRVFRPEAVETVSVNLRRLTLYQESFPTITV